MRNKKIIYALGAVLIAGIIIILVVLPGLFFHKGLSELQNKHFVKAHKYLKIAKNLKPKNKEYQYNYVYALSSLRPVYNIQKEMFQLSQDKSNDSASQLAQVQINFWKSKINKTYGDNYIEQTPYDGKVLRWATFPLRIYIDFPEGDKLPEYYESEISNAFAQWQSSSGFLKFDFTDNKKDAQIAVKFLPLPKNNCKQGVCKYVVAYTEPLIRGNSLKKMTITMYDKDAYGNYFSDKEIYNTILHEIGHALGIMGHSFSTDDLMYMSRAEEGKNIYTRFRSDFQYISAKDINTVTLLYNLVPDITNISRSKIKKEKLIYPPILLGSLDDMQNWKVKEAQNYIKNAPDLPGGYIDLAIAYATLGQKTKALSALRKALMLSKTNDDKYIVYYNLSVLEMNSKNLSKALEYAHQAQQIADTDEVADLISNIEHAMSTKKKPFKSDLISE